MSALRGVPTRVVVVTGLLLALLLAGVVSHYASASPDGLNRVAGDEGFAETEQQRNGAAPFAGYETSGVDHDRLSGGLAGVAGCLVVLVVAGGLTQVLRLRRRSDHADAQGAEQSAEQPEQPAEHR